MADTANSVAALNNMLPSINVVHKDARYLEHAEAGPTTPADLVVFEVRAHAGRGGVQACVTLLHV